MYDGGLIHGLAKYLQVAQVVRWCFFGCEHSSSLSVMLFTRVKLTCSGGLRSTTLESIGGVDIETTNPRIKDF